MNLLCFADERMTISQQKLIESWNDLQGGDIYKAREDSIKAEFRFLNSEIFSQERGYSYWIWKPYLIYNVLKSMPSGAFLFYSDSGTELINPLWHIENAMNENEEDIFLFAGRFRHIEWVKMDVVKSINHENLSVHHTHDGPMYSMNGYESFAHVQASQMFFCNTERAKNFVKEWLLYCQMPGFIDDSPSKEPNYPTFAEHRHDQAILTCLQIKYKIPLHWWPGTMNMDRQNDFPNDRYPALFNHHRKRNEDW